MITYIPNYRLHVHLWHMSRILNTADTCIIHRKVNEKVCCVNFTKNKQLFGFSLEYKTVL